MSGSRKPNDSPAWKNPRDMIKRALKRKSSSRCLNSSLSLAAPLESEIQTESAPPPLTACSFTSHNQFKKGSPQKKRSRVDLASPDWDDSTACDGIDGSVLGRMETERRIAKRNDSKLDMAADLSEMYALDFSGIAGGDVGTPKTKLVKEEKHSSTIPIDARLGTKLKITCRQPFPWMTNTTTSSNAHIRIAAAEKHAGLTHFIAMYNNAITPNPCPPAEASGVSLLHAASLYWQYPALPWMSLYPRIDTLLRTMPRQSNPPMAKTMQDMLTNQWTECLDDLYLSWKKGSRHSFYVCCPTFTVYFTSRAIEEGVDTEDSMSCFRTAPGHEQVVILTPTTAGFRRYLRQEDVEFELMRESAGGKGGGAGADSRAASRLAIDMSCASQPPLFRDVWPSGEKENEGAGASGLCDGGRGGEGEMEERDTCASADDSEENASPEKLNCSGDQADWLQNLGMSPASTLRLTKHRSMGSGGLNSAGSEEGDRQPNGGAILVRKPSSIQALFNVLQTDKVCRSIAGPHAGLPPTLLAPAPFLYAQMQQLKKTSLSVRRVGAGGMEYVCEMEGPVLPHASMLASEAVRRMSLGACELRVRDRDATRGFTNRHEQWMSVQCDDGGFTWV